MRQAMQPHGEPRKRGDAQETDRGSGPFRGYLDEFVDEAPCLFMLHDFERPHTISVARGVTAAVLGYEWRELIGESASILCDIEQLTTNPQLRTGGAIEVDTKMRRKDGSLTWVRLVCHLTSDGQVASIGLPIDRMKERELSGGFDRLDRLTGLPNRELLMERLTDEATRSEVLFGILDLNSFRYVNDTLGHDVGDRILATIGRRLSAIAVDGMVFGRLGGDAFGVLVSGSHAAERSDDVARLIHEQIGRSINVDDVELQVRLSIGFALGDDSLDSAEFLRQADMALGEAKQVREPFVLYTATNRPDSAAQLADASRLNRHLETELVMWLQPIVDLRTGEAVAVEGLARWNHPTRGVLSPRAFLDTVFATGLADRLDFWAFESAATFGALETTSGCPLEIAVNISAAGLRAPQFVPRVRKLLRRGVLAPEQLMIEISEKDIDSDLHLLRPVLEELRELNVGLALDDFGIGNSSFVRLRDLPFTKLKIDRAFVTKMLDKPIDMAIVRAVVELGRSLDLPVVAEGVEDAATAQLLGEIGCEQAQGYHFARPKSVDTLLESGLIASTLRHSIGDAA